MSSLNLTVFNPFSGQGDVPELQSLAQELVYYAESRFRSILISYNQSPDKKRLAMAQFLGAEVVSIVLDVHQILISTPGLCDVIRRVCRVHRPSYRDTGINAFPGCIHVWAASLQETFLRIGLQDVAVIGCRHFAG